MSESGTGAPVAGALVRLLASDGESLRSTMTSSDGRYRLQVPEGGTWGVRVERIGYDDSAIRSVEVAGDAVAFEDVVLVERAIELRGLTVDAGGRRCDLTQPGDDGPQRLWSQVRKALDAASWTTRQGSLRFRLRQWVRTLSPGDGTILDERPSYAQSRAGNSVRSLPARQLADEGYVRVADDGSIEYFAPDAEVLLSDSFLSQHCFTVVDGGGSPDGAAAGDDGQVGLAFEPRPGRELPDVEGVLWVDATSGRLDRLTFRYTDLDRTGLNFDVGEDAAAGEVRYVELADGRWVVREWWIRAPGVEVVRERTRFGSRDRQRVGAIYETGAAISFVEGRNFAWAPDRQNFEVRGVVFDSTAAGPLDGAVVRLAGRGWRTRADEAGRFVLSDVPAGRYRLVFEHDRLTELGLEPRTLDLTLDSVGVDDVRLVIPPITTLLAEGCADTEAGRGHIVGRVTAPDGETAMGGLGVAVRETSGLEGSSSEAVVSQATVGPDGTYRLCDVPAGRALRVELESVRADRAQAEVTVPEGGHGRVDLVVSWSEARGIDLTAAGGMSVGGTVTDASDGRPLPSVSVEVLDAQGEVVDRSTTDASGAFRLSVDREDPRRVRFSALGFGEATTGELPRASRRHRIDVRLAPTALEIEGLTASVDARALELDDVGFYDREERTIGTFLDREELQIQSVSRTTEALMRVPGIQTVDQASETNNTTRRYIQFRAAARASFGSQSCVPAVYIDGALMRQGGPLGRAGGAGAADPDVPSLDELVSDEEILAVELYDSPATIPAQFAGAGTLCGAIVIWRRR